MGGFFGHPPLSFSKGLSFKVTSKFELLNPFKCHFTKWSNTLKQFVGNLQTNCLSVFDHFVGLALKGLMNLF